MTSSETHQSLLILKRPVFGLVLHHCRNILIKTPRSETLRSASRPLINLRRKRRTRRGRTRRGRTRHVGLPSHVRLCNRFHIMSSPAWCKAPSPPRCVRACANVRACVREPDEREWLDVASKQRWCGLTAKHRLPPPLSPSRCLSCGLTGLDDVRIFFSFFFFLRRCDKWLFG